MHYHIVHTNSKALDEFCKSIFEMAHVPIRRIIDRLSPNAPVKFFCPHPPRAAPGSEEKCVWQKKGEALENEVKKGRGTEKWGDQSD